MHGRGEDIRISEKVAISDCFVFCLISSYTNFYGVTAVSIIIFQPYTQGNFHLLKEGVMIIYTR